MSAIVEGIERAVFGEVTTDYVTDWLDRQIYSQLSLHVQNVLFRTGRLAAVYGLQLSDGTAIVAKVHHRFDIAQLKAADICQKLLADNGYPCPTPVGQPIVIDNRALVIETMLEAGEVGNAHNAPIRRAMANSLAQQITLLRDVPTTVRANFGNPPAWAVYEYGPWPTPHDAIFDFSHTPEGYEWVDQLAQKAADILRPRPQADSIGHCDWVCQNLRFGSEKVVASYDWDSLISEAEPVLVAISAAAFTEGSTAGFDTPTPDELVAFFIDYEANRAKPFDKSEQQMAVAAATWVLSYNARCGVSAETWGYPAKDGTPLAMLRNYGEAYLKLRW